MEISAFKAGYYDMDLARDALGTTKAQLTALTKQLNTGQVSTTYGGLGAARGSVLDLNAKISATNGYLNTIANASSRISFLNAALTQLAANASSSASETAYAFTFNNGTTTAQVSAANYLSQAIDLLNTEIGGTYIFSGRSTDTRPVADYDSILNGDATHAGVRQLIAERKQADLGSGSGRLTLTSAGTTVTLAEEAGQPFGFKLATPAESGLSNVTVSGPAGGAIAIDFAGQPNVGEAVSLTLSLPDGSTAEVALKAVAAGTAPGPGEFALGATAADTAASFQTALSEAVGTTAKTELAAASALKASQDFFAGSTSNPPARIAPPYASATGFLSPADAAASTVIWYKGDDDSSVAARDTSAQRIDASQVVGIGARANEAPIRNALAQWAALAAESFTPGSDTDTVRYQALTSRLQAGFAGGPGVPSIQDIASEISVANVAVSAAKGRNTQRLSMYQGSLSDMVSIDPATVLTQILSLQTRLQASYQITSSMAQLSLANYLR